MLYWLKIWLISVDRKPRYNYFKYRYTSFYSLNIELYLTSEAIRFESQRVTCIISQAVP